MGCGVACGRDGGYWCGVRWGAGWWFLGIRGVREVVGENVERY